MYHSDGRLPVFGRKLGCWLVVGICLLVAGCSSIEERIQAHYDRGLELLKEGEPVKAGLEFRNALSLDNDFVPALYELAKVELGRGEFVRAAGFFQKVAEIDQQHIESRIELAKIFMLANRIENATRYTDEAFALDPTRPRILANKAAIAMRNQKFDEAKEFADQVLLLEPDNSDALIVLAAIRMADKDMKGALEVLSRGVEENEGFLGLQLLKLTALEALSETAEIEETFKDIIQRDPKKTELRYAFARWYISKGRMEEAEAVIRSYADENPELTEARLNFIRFVRQERGIEAALQELNEVIEAQKTDIFDYEFAYAELLFLSNKNAEGIELVKNLITKEPEPLNKMRARLYLADKYLRLGRSDESKILVDAILQEDPKNSGALEVRAALLISERKDVEAIETLVEARDLQPNSTNILRLLAFAYERVGRIELAEESLVKAVQIDNFKPGLGLNLTSFLFRHGKADHAEDILSRIIENAPADTSALAELAKIKLRKKQWIEAESIATKLEAADSNNRTLANEIRAAALAGQKKYEESIEMLKGVLTDGTGIDASLSNLFNVYLRAEKYEDARKLVEDALEANPQDPRIQVRLGVLHYLQKNLAKAEAAYKKAIEIGPDALVGYYALTDFYMKTGRFDDAIAIGNRGTKLDGNVLPLRFLLAQIFEQTKKIEEAISEYEQIFLAEPRSLVAANNLASLLSEKQASEADLDRAFEIANTRLRNTKVPQFLDTLGRIHYLRGDYANAVSFLKPAAEGLPNMPIVQFHLGMAYKGLNRDDLAEEVLLKAKSLMGDGTFSKREELLAALEQLSNAKNKKTAD